MLPKTQPISEETKGPFGSTDTTNRTFFGFGARRNIVVIVVLLGLVANSLLRMLTYVPDSTSRQNQMNESVMTTARMKQPYDTEITAKETVPKKVVEAFACNDTR
jgi:hypothetical protein